MIIEPRFNGPSDSGNGGYAAGTFAAAYPTGPGAAVEVTLRRPPPLGLSLRLDGDAVRDPDGTLVAELRTVPAFPDEAVPPVDPATAAAVAVNYPGFVEHPFPACYVCGPERADGLRIFPGRLPDGRTAAPFGFPEGGAEVTVWAALDCPGGWAVLSPGRPYVLGRMAAVVERLPAPGDECVVTGVAVEAQGRKALVRSSVYGPDGHRLGYARATWIAV
ncbi:hypothetical protein [Plantactinospora sp. KBS50]|uniref:hypothetical protein n=1 Tax=Plantactinospora sp. KBS50 TaxID=2024580 RepID=UPI000BAADB8A|nr:hypothetical protein [Plantactinospora sp. KBS50]ASW56555.1 hypothetical protein CIK06_23945 [Plantactinospora sp. KBS50]